MSISTTVLIAVASYGVGLGVGWFHWRDKAPRSEAHACRVGSPSTEQDGDTA